MNNKKIFSVKLFWQTFKQLKLSGIIMTIILLAVNIYPVVGEIVASYFSVYSEGSHHRYIVDGVSGCETLIITFLIMAPILAFNAWNFLNKRNSSDFYHSLPYKRECIFLSKISAVLAWIAGMLLISYVTVSVIYIINKDFFKVDFASMALTYISMFICNFLCVAGISLACSFTGSLFSNICVSLIIIFVPNILLNLIGSAVWSSICVVSEEIALGILSQLGNMPAKMVSDIFGYNDMYSIIRDVGNNVYTVVLAFIYAALACVLFKRRKSEASGKDAGGKLSRMVIRAAIAFVICIIPVLAAVVSYGGGVTNKKQAIVSDILYIGAFFIIAAVVVIVYECIVSKNFRNIVSCLPSIAIAYVLSIATGVAVFLYCQSILDYNPDLNKIEYITVSSKNGMYANDYFKGQVEKIKIKDEKIIKLICEILEDNVEKVRDDSVNYYSYYDVLLNYNIYIKDSAFGTYRTISLKESQRKELVELLSGLDEYKEVYRDLPSIDKAEMGNWSFETKDYKKYNEYIYNTLLEELKTVKLSDWIDSFENSDLYSNAHKFSVDFVLNGKVYSESLPITSVIPKTREAYLNVLNEIYLTSDEYGVNELLGKLKEVRLTGSYKNSDRYPVNIAVHTNGSDDYSYFDIAEYAKEEPELSGKLIDKAISDIEAIQKSGKYEHVYFDFSKDYYCIDCTIYDAKDDSFEYIEYYFYLDMTNF